MKLAHLANFGCCIGRKLSGDSRDTATGPMFPGHLGQPHDAARITLRRLIGPVFDAIIVNDVVLPGLKWRNVLPVAIFFVVSA